MDWIPKMYCMYKCILCQEADARAAEEVARKRESEEVLLKVESGLQEMALPTTTPIRTSAPDQPDQQPNITVLVEELERIESHTWITWIQTTREQMQKLAKSDDPEVRLVKKIERIIFNFLKQK